MPVLRVSFGTVMAAVEQRLLTAAAVGNVAQVIWLGRDDPTPHVAGDRDILLRPSRVQAAQSWSDGGSRSATAVRRYLYVKPRLAQLLDGTPHDKKWLAAYHDFEDAVVDALQMDPPEDDAGDWLLIEPMRLLEGQSPTKRQGQQAWGDGALAFEFFYLPNINPAEVTP